jgi:hypothetical protein
MVSAISSSNVSIRGVISVTGRLGQRNPAAFFLSMFNLAMVLFLSPFQSCCRRQHIELAEGKHIEFGASTEYIDITAPTD